MAINRLFVAQQGVRSDRQQKAAQGLLVTGAPPPPPPPAVASLMKGILRVGRLLRP